MDPIQTAPGTAGESGRYCLGSRRRDLLAAVLSALVVLAGSPFLRVYHRITVMDLTVVRIETDGRRTPVPTPSSIWNAVARLKASRRTPGATLRTLERGIQQVMQDDPAIASAPAGTRFEWIVRYSENNVRLDRVVVYQYSMPTDVAR